MRESLQWTVLEAQFPDVIPTLFIGSNLDFSVFVVFLSRSLMVLRPVSTCTGLHSTRFHVDFLWPATAPAPPLLFCECMCECYDLVIWGCAVPRAVTGVTPLVPRTSSTLASIPLGLRMLLALASLYKVRSLLPFRGFGF